jgi:uncharacterized protein with HEPN domain
MDGWHLQSEWLALRQLRNQMIHEYIEDTQTLFDALSTAHINKAVLEQFAGMLEKQVRELLAE